MQKQSAVKIGYHEVDQYQSSSRPRANSLPALTRRFKSTLSRTHRHSSYSSSFGLRSTPASAPSPQTKSHVRSLSDSFPRINLRSLFVGRARSDKPRRNTAGLLNNIEPRKCPNTYIPDVATSNNPNRVYLDIYDGNLIPSQYAVTGPIREEELLALDILLSAGQFTDDEDLSEPEEDDMLMMQEMVLGRIDFRL